MCTFSEQLIQEAQLSQTDRAMLGVIEYFATSLNVTEGHVNCEMTLLSKACVTPYQYSIEIMSAF